MKVEECGDILLLGREVDSWCGWRRQTLPAIQFCVYHDDGGAKTFTCTVNFTFIFSCLLPFIAA